MMRKDLNYLNTNCRVYDIHFTETEFMNQTRDKLIQNAIFDVPHASTEIKEEGINRQETYTGDRANCDGNYYLQILMVKHITNWYYKINSIRYKASNT